ncbi:MAG: hypothetical protein ABL949_09515 [Fimbriimonadaceae bacterium]
MSLVTIATAMMLPTLTLAQARTSVQYPPITLTNSQVEHYEGIAAGYLETIFEVERPKGGAMNWRSSPTSVGLRFYTEKYHVSIDYPSGLLRLATNAALEEEKAKDANGGSPLKLSDDAWYRRAEALATKIWPDHRFTRLGLDRTNSRGTDAHSGFANTVRLKFWSQVYRGKRRSMTIILDDSTGKVLLAGLSTPQQVKR